MNFSYLKYLVALCVPATLLLSMESRGWMTWSTVIYAYFLIPFLELFFKSDKSNLSEDEEKKFLNNIGFDIVVYVLASIHILLLFRFLYIINDYSYSASERIGLIMGMGISCGVLGINVAHELGHRKSRLEQLLAKTLLLTSLYMHFFIEHNRGHHKNVSTPQDPSSARKHEMLYVFWLRSIIGAYLSAWKIESTKLRNKGNRFFSIRNEMLMFQVIQMGFLVLIFYFFGFSVMLYFVGAAVVGIIQLETINYIEHYGLIRSMNDSGRYERVQPKHSWNSNHLIGRLTLFELSRHSDHHYMSSRKYQILKFHEASPQMPTGYPGMMILSLVPPLWFYIMNKRVSRYIK